MNDCLAERVTIAIKRQGHITALVPIDDRRVRVTATFSGGQEVVWITSPQYVPSLGEPVTMRLTSPSAENDPALSACETIE